MKIGKGFRTQGGLPRKPRMPKAKPNGLLLRAAVTATYVTDSVEHPKIADLNNPPCAVYCDVLVYGGAPGADWFNLPKVLVSQKRGGIHNDDLWKPSATSKNVLGELNNTFGSNPGSLDGDHVLVGFMNNSYQEPIILRGIPHPSRDLYNELYGSGKRIKLKEIDGDPDFVKHHGVFRGVDDNGNFIVNSTFGNDGTTDDAGLEPSPDTTGTSGNQSFVLPENSVYSVTLQNMSSPLSPVESVKLSVKNNNGNLEVSVDGQNCLTVDGAGALAEATIGNGAVSATVAEVLQTTWGLLVTALNAHVHGDGTAAVFSPTVPTWPSDANSDKLTFPSN